MWKSNLRDEWPLLAPGLDIHIHRSWVKQIDLPLKKVDRHFWVNKLAVLGANQLQEPSFVFILSSPEWQAYKKAAERRWHEGDLTPYYNVWCGRPAGTLLYLWTAVTNGWHTLFCDWGTSMVMCFIKRSCLTFIKPYRPTMWLDANSKFKFHPFTLVEGSGSWTTKAVRSFEGGKQFYRMETRHSCILTFESNFFCFFVFF